MSNCGHSCRPTANHSDAKGGRGGRHRKCFEGRAALFWQSHTAAAAASNEEEAFGAEFGLRLIGGDHWAPFGQTIGGGEGGLNRQFLLTNIKNVYCFGTQKLSISLQIIA